MREHKVNEANNKRNEFKMEKGQAEIQRLAHEKQKAVEAAEAVKKHIKTKLRLEEQKEYEQEWRKKETTNERTLWLTNKREHKLNEANNKRNDFKMEEGIPKKKLRYDKKTERTHEELTHEVLPISYIERTELSGQKKNNEILDFQSEEIHDMNLREHKVNEANNKLCYIM